MISEGNLGIVIQARMGSSRLPAKIMMQINNKSILTYQLERLKVLGYPIYIATTLKPQDDCIEEFARNNAFLCFRGEEDNVLKRYYDCANYFNLNTIIRVTSDCPLIDAGLIHQGILQFIETDSKKLYLSNTLQRTFPRGADFEIFSYALLKDAYENAVEDSDIEHVTPYIWKNKSGEVDVMQITQADDFSAFRLTLDTPEDFQLIEELIKKHSADKLNMGQICKIMTENPGLHEINAHIEQKKN